VQQQKYSNKNESLEDIYKHLNHKNWIIYIWGCFDNDIFWKKVGCFYMYMYLSLCHLLLVMLTIYSLNLSHSSKIWLSWLVRSFGKIVFCPSLKIEDYIFHLFIFNSFFIRFLFYWEFKLELLCTLYQNFTALASW
jgi:hypothetical protein